MVRENRAAYHAGCRRFDGAIQDLELSYGWDLTGNMPTEKLLSYFTAIKKILI
jgi:hydroxymethylglutaryl-CoA lyase